jgi:3-phosphoshikimate 1-carboxyvinyltransferase
MRALINPHVFSGTIRSPASKSHTIRRLLMAALTGGVSEIEYPLDSLDARSCAAVCRALGARVEEHRAADDQNPNPPDAGGNKLSRWTLRGMDDPAPSAPSLPAPLDVGNSGTTLFLALAVAALGSRAVSFTGDEQIRRRGAAPLLDALSGLGVRVDSATGGCVPITVRGPWKGGRVSLPCPTSQYLSALLLAAPLAPAGTLTEIEVPLLNERPYVELTLSYLASQGVPYEAAADLSRFRIPGGSAYKPINGPVPGDFSSAAFPACAAVVSWGRVSLLGLEKEDLQGDKAFFDMLVRMGCEAVWEASVPGARGGPALPEWRLTLSRKGPLRGGEFDLNATPDLLPVMAVTAAFAAGKTALVNAAHARLKETDRIAVMAEELGKRGIKTEERPDGLIIHGAGDRPGPALRGGLADGRGDHRIVMALAAAALGASEPVEIEGAESAAVTYPGFLDLLNAEIKP